VAYRIVTDPHVRAQIRALPTEVLPALAELMAVVELVPWSAPPYHEENPDSPMRQLPLAGGRGFVTYMVLDSQDRVDLLDITWFG
jgi:hypothetical protein